MNPDEARPTGDRTHRVFYAALTGAWVLSQVALFVGLPALLLWSLAVATSAPLAIWSLSMLVIVGLALRARDRHRAPGRVLARDEAPRLYDLVERARRVAGIGPVGEIRLHSMPNVWVTRVFRGGILYSRPVKVLVIGLPYLRALTVPELESILLHEFAHFLGQDVRRGERLEDVSARLRELRRAFDRTGAAKWLNPVYLWARLFGGLFRVATSRIRRRQELLADALAAETCGTRVYSRALVKCAATRRLFFRVAVRLTADALRDGRVPDNVFRDFREGVRRLSPRERRRTLREVRGKGVRPFAGHPPLADRLDALGRRFVPRRRRPEERAANLLVDLDAVERELTPGTLRLLTATLVVRARRRGVPLPEARPRSPEPVGAG